MQNTPTTTGGEQPVNRSVKRRRSNPEGTAPTPFIVDTTCMFQALCDLHRDEESLMFKNCTGDLELLIQPTSEPTDEYMTFDLNVVYDETLDAHGKVGALLGREYGSIQNEDGTWTLFVFSMPRTSPPREELEETMKYLNGVYNMRYCECFEYLIKAPNRHMCYMCTIRGRIVTGQTEQVECVICNDPVKTSRGVVVMRACCSQIMHRRCLEMWRRDDTTKVCPVCRSRASDN